MPTAECDQNACYCPDKTWPACLSQTQPNRQLHTYRDYQGHEEIHDNHPRTVRPISAGDVRKKSSITYGNEGFRRPTESAVALTRPENAAEMWTVALLRNGKFMEDKFDNRNTSWRNKP